MLSLEAGVVSDGASTITFSEIETVRLGSGNDTINGGTDAVGLNIDGGGGNDLFNASGTSGGDRLEGNAGNDTILAGSGDDSLGG